MDCRYLPIPQGSEGLVVSMTNVVFGSLTPRMRTCSRFHQHYTSTFFADILSTKITNLNCKHTKAVQNTFIQKIWSQHVGEMRTCSQFHQYFTSSFLLVFFSQKITNPNGRHIRASQTLLYKKAAQKMLVVKWIPVISYYNILHAALPWFSFHQKPQTYKICRKNESTKILLIKCWLNGNL